MQLQRNRKNIFYKLYTKTKNIPAITTYNMSI